MVRAYAHYPALETNANSASGARGIMSDCGVYWMDFILSITHEAGPRRAFSTGSRKIVGGAPDTQVVCYEFESFTAVWEHRSGEMKSDPTLQSGCYFYGALGTLHVDTRGEWEFDSEGFRQDQTQTRMLSEKRLTKTEMAERARRAKKLCKLAMASYELGRAIAWDAARGVCIGDDAASRILNAV
jgi:predicted dehydrogenase